MLQIFNDKNQINSILKQRNKFDLDLEPNQIKMDGIAYELQPIFDIIKISVKKGDTNTSQMGIGMLGNIMDKFIDSGENNIDLIRDAQKEIQSQLADVGSFAFNEGALKIAISSIECIERIGLKIIDVRNDNNSCWDIRDIAISTGNKYSAGVYYIAFRSIYSIGIRLVEEFQQSKNRDLMFYDIASPFLALSNILKNNFDKINVDDCEKGFQWIGDLIISIAKIGVEKETKWGITEICKLYPLYNENESSVKIFSATLLNIEETWRQVKGISSSDIETSIVWIELCRCNKELPKKSDTRFLRIYYAGEFRNTYESE